MKNFVDDLYDGCGCLGATLIMVVIVALVLAMAFGLFCLEGWIFMLLWNWLAVALFSAPMLTYWVCVGIVFALHFLGRILFKSSVKIKNGD